jgi:hypothetical protein
MANFGLWLRNYIAKRLYLSQTEFRQRAKLSPDTLNRVLKMKSPEMNPRTFRMLAQGAGLTPGQLDELWQKDQGFAVLVRDDKGTITELPPELAREIARQAHANGAAAHEWIINRLAHEFSLRCPLAKHFSRAPSGKRATQKKQK